MLQGLTFHKCTALTNSAVVPSPPCTHGWDRTRDVRVQITRRGQLAALISASTPLLSKTAGSAEYDRYAATYDNLDDGSPAALLGLPDLRSRLLAQASGRVLETAAGTGINLSFYDLHSLDHITMIDLSEGMLSRAKAKAANLQIGQKLDFVSGDVQDLPFRDSAFDTVTDTFSFCVFPSPQAAMNEMARVLKPGGQLLLLEHSRSPNAALGWYQDVTEKPVKSMGKGCSWNQRLESMINTSGLNIVDARYDLLGTVVSIIATKVP